MAGAPVAAGTICLDTANHVSAHALVPPNGERWLNPICAIERPLHPSSRSFMEC